MDGDSPQRFEFRKLTSFNLRSSFFSFQVLPRHIRNVFKIVDIFNKDIGARVHAYVHLRFPRNELLGIDAK